MLRLGRAPMLGGPMCRPQTTFASRRWTVEIVKRPQGAEGFTLLPRRWVVERTIAWLNRNRRLAKDFEASIESALAWLMIASVKLLTRRIVMHICP